MNKFFMTIIISIAMLMGSASVFAEDNQVFGMGANYNSVNNPSISGTMLYAKQISDGTYSFNLFLSNFCWFLR